MPMLHWIMMNVVQRRITMIFRFHLGLHGIAPNFPPPQPILTVPFKRAFAVQLPQFFESCQNGFCTNQKMIVIWQNHPSFQLAIFISNGFLHAFRKLAHSIRRTTDHKSMLITGGSDEIAPCSTINMNRTVPWATRLPPNRQLQISFFIGQLPPSVHGNILLKKGLSDQGSNSSAGVPGSLRSFATACPPRTPLLIQTQDRLKAPLQQFPRWSSSFSLSPQAPQPPHPQGRLKAPLQQLSVGVQASACLPQAPLPPKPRDRLKAPLQQLSVGVQASACLPKLRCHPSPKIA